MVKSRNLMLGLILVIAVTTITTTVNRLQESKERETEVPSEEDINAEVPLTYAEQEKANAMMESTFKGVTFREVGTVSSYENETPIAIIKELETIHLDAEKMGITYDLMSSDTSVAANTKLYELCLKYFVVDTGSYVIPPLLPMAIANNETPGRADSSITYSALFPSAVLRINSVEDIENFDCTVVLSDAIIFRALATEHSTRDRGALQMNPNYGSGVSIYLDSLMGPSEASKLSKIHPDQYSNYRASQTKDTSTITVQKWVANASVVSGDRFNVKDCILRMASACTRAVDQINASGYVIRTKAQLLVMMGQYHGASGVWSPSTKDSNIGNWKSGNLAYEYSVAIGSDKMYSLIKTKAVNDLARSRTIGNKVSLTISDQQAMALWEQARNNGIVEEYDYYIDDGNYYWVTQCYPIRLLYNYILLELLYSGE